jgi:cell division protein FtsN
MVEQGGKALIVSVLASSRLWSDVSELLTFGFALPGSAEPRFVSLKNAAVLSPPVPARPVAPKSVEPKLPEPKPRQPRTLEVRGRSSSSYTVQVGAFRDKRMAETLRQRLRQHGYSASVTTTGTRNAKFYRVRLGEFDSPADAERFISRLRSQMGLKAVVAAAN